MPDSPSTARELLVRFPNSRRDVSGCSRVRESPCRLAGSVFRTKRTTAIEPANNGPRFKPKLPNHQTQTTQEPFTSKSSALTRAGGLCPPGYPLGPPRFSALGQSRRAETETGRPPCVTAAPRLRSWLLARRSGRVSAWPCPSARSLAILPMTSSWNHYRCAPSPRRLREFPALPHHCPTRPMRRIPSATGRILSRTDCSECVIRDPGRSFFGSHPFLEVALETQNIRDQPALGI